MATPGASGAVVELLDQRSPRWEVALHRVKPWRARARDGSIYRQHYVRDPRSVVKLRF
jgi:hypothetical protein